MKAPKKELKPNPLHQQLKDFATKNADNIGYNKEYVEELSTITPENTSYKGVEALHAPKEADIYDPYEAYINRTELHSGRFDINELNRLRAENQSNWAQAGNAIGQLAVNIVPQIASTVSNMINVPGWFSAEAAAANPIQEWASGIKEWSQEAMPIYEETPGQMNMADPAWWFSRGEGLIESMTSFAIPGGIAGKAVSAGFKGLGAVTRGKQLARAVLGAEKSAGLLKGMSTLGTAALLNQAEGATIAADVYKNTLDYQLKKNGGNVDLAKKMASEAAATAMSINRINILLNLTSASAFLTPFKQTRNLLKTQGIGSTLSKIGLEAGQESTEELINLVGQKAGEAKGREEEDYVAKGLESIGTMEGFESVFLGALGGAGQTGLVDASQYSKYGAGSTKDAEGNRISYAQYQSDLYNQQQQTIKELEDQGVQVSDSLMNVKDAVVFNEKRNKAAAEGNQEEYDRLNNQMFENQALKAFQSGTTEVLENLYKAEAERDVEEVGQEYIDKANQAVKDLQTLESVYNNFEEYANVNDIFFNRANKIRTDRNLGYIQDAAKTNNLELAQLVRNIAGKYEYDVEREVLYKKEGEIQRTETVTEKAPLTYSMSDLENNTGQTEGQKKVYNKFLKEVKKLDAYKREMGYQQAISNGEKILEDNNKEFAELTSPEAQETALLKQEKVAAIKSAYKEVASTSSRARIQTLMDSIEDPDFKRVAQLRLDALDKAKASNLQQKKKDLAIKTMESKISKATLEDLVTIQEEINKADPNDISKTAKAALLNKVEFRARQLNNQVLDPQEAAELRDPFADFDSRTPEELENEIELEQKSFDTTIPSDFPNNEKEGKDVETEVENAAVDLLGSDKSLIIGTDENGNLVYNYEKSAEGYNRAAFLSREFNQTENVGIVDREEITNDVINSKLLDPDFLLAGTALTMEVDNDYTGEKYDPTSTTRETIAWPLRLKQIIDKYEALGQDYRQSYEYITEAPIKVTTTDGQTVFYVHDNAWYRAENLSASPEEIAIDKEKNFLIRKAIISKGKVNSKVDYKSFGRLFKTADGKKVTVSEAMPDKNLVLGIGKDGAIELSGNSSEVIKDAKILKNNPEDGRLYAVVKVGPNEYMPIPLQRKPINQETVDSIILAIEAHLTNDPENAVVKAIAESSLGLDITTTKGLSDYLSQFIYIYPTEGKEGLENALISNGGTKSTLKSSMPLITVTPTGIQFGRPGIQAANYMDANNNKIVQYAINISQNFNKTTAGEARNSLNLNKLRTVLESGKVLTNANKNTLSKDGNSVIILNAEGDTKTDTYREFVKENYESNILSVNVGTDENPKWAYTIQPTILFDTAFANMPTQVVASKAQPTVAPTPGISVGKELSPAAKQKLAKLGFSEEILAIMSPADIEIAKTFSSKEDAQDLIKKYTKPTTGPTASVSADIEAKKVDIENRKQIGDSISRPGDQSSYEKNKFTFTYVKPFNLNELDKVTPSNQDNYVLNKYGEQETFDNYDEGKKWLDAKYDAELITLEQPSTDTEAKIADIEKRRQAALVFERKMNAAGTELLFTSKSKEFALGWITEEEAKKEINAKYDAELAALEKAETSSSTTTQKVKTKEEIRQEIITLQEKINTYKYEKEQEEIFNNLNKNILPEGFRFKENQFGVIEKFIPEEDKWINVVENILLKDKDPLTAIDLYFNQKGLGKTISNLKKEYLNQIKPFEEKEAQEDAELEKKQAKLLATKEGILLRKDWSAGIGLDYEGDLASGVIENSSSKDDTDKFTGDSFSIKEDGISWGIYEVTGSTKQEVLDKINADYDAELAALEAAPIASKISVEEQVEQNISASLAENILAQGVDLAEINDTIEALNSGNINEEALAEAGYESTEQALAAYQEAKDLYNKRAEDTETITLPNGEIITITGNDLDINDLAEDEIDDFLVREMTPEQVEAQKEEIDDMIIYGLNTTTQSSLISFLSADIINAALSAKEVGGKRSVKAKEILDKHEESFKILSEFFKKKGLVNRAKHVDAILSQFDKVRRLVNQNMSKFTTGNLSEEVEYDDNQQAVGLERTYADDWTFTVDSKNTASADLKQFFSVITAQDENGVIKNPLGFNEIIPFDVVYNTLHELLANKPADYETMIDILELNYNRFPWIKSVVEKLEAAPERIQNEFVSDMSKHHIDMQFVMWSKDPNGNYLLQTWSANKSSIENRLRAIWSSNLKGVATQSNLVYVDENDVYQFNRTVADSLIAQAEEFGMKPEDVTNEALATWLGNFGIVLNDETYNDLRKGRYFNNGRQDWNKLFNSSKGIVKVLAKELKKKIDGEIDVENSNILNDTAVKALASLDAANTLNSFSNSFRAGGKTVYSYGNNNFLVNRMRDLTAYDSQNKMFLNPDLIDNLKNISFSRDSLWLDELTSDKEIGDKTRQTLKVGYLSLEALKRLYTKSEDNRKLNNLTAAEHEVTKLGFFQNVSGDVIDKEARRVVDFFYLTMSDKTTMLTIKALAREVNYTNSTLSEDNLKLLYKAMVQPEINRIRDKQAKNVKGYEPNYFYFLPALNKLTINVNGVTKNFLDIVLDKTDVLYDPVVQKAVMSEISKAFNILVTKKLKDWDNFGIGKTIVDEKGKVTDNYTFLDKSYMETVAKGPKGRARVEYAAADMVFNYLISNAEGSKLFAGDPALYAKFKTKKKYAESINKTVETLTEEDLEAWLNQNLQDTFINITKRLAGDIAPGMELANSMDNVYYQVYLEDKEIASNNIKDSIQREFFEKIVSTYADKKKGYGAIEGSDAQEYTTWQEHLYVMKQLGRLTKKQFDTFTKKLTAQSQGNFSRENQLTYDELGIILQPIKPVYVGNIASKEENVDRRIYIKSSSFPLIPELTSGLQIDKIRKGLEKFETEVGKTVTKDGVPAFVRASFGTANKVGAVKNSVATFDDNGNVLDNFEVKPENTLLLSRANFRIQQDVPYKREKDSINVGTQEAVLLFVNLLNTKVTDDKTGKELLDNYNKNYQELFAYNQEKLAKKLGLIEEVADGADLSNLTSIPTTEVFTKVEEFNNKLKSASPIKKVSMQEVFAEEVGEDTLERVNFINKNFDKIVEELAKAKVNIFFDENNEFKKCD
jgi:hypothetical protein